MLFRFVGDEAIYEGEITGLVVGQHYYYYCVQSSPVSPSEAEASSEGWV